MRKLLNNPKVVAVLALGALGTVGFTVWSEMKPPAPRSARVAQVASTEEASAVPDSSPSLGEADGVGLNSLAALVAKPKRDPFAVRRMSETVTEAEAELPDTEETVQLSAVWTQEGAQLVLLNGRICRVGETVGRLSIDRITREGVWLKHWKGSDFVKVGSRFVLKTPARMLAAVSTQ